MSSAQLSTSHLASGVRSICLATFLTCPRRPLSSAAVHRGEHWLSAPCCRAHPNSFGVYRHTEDISSAPWDALDLWLTAACLPAWAMNRHTEDISSAPWDVFDLWLTAPCLPALSFSAHGDHLVCTLGCFGYLALCTLSPGVECSGTRRSILPPGVSEQLRSVPPPSGALHTARCPPHMWRNP